MGYLALSTRFAILSLGLLGIAGCRNPPPPERSQQVSEIVVCPGDVRCGQINITREIEVPTKTCRADKANLVFQCGPQNLPCPGAGCPTGEPGLPSQQCRITETYVTVKCPGGPPGPTDPAATAMNEAPQAAPTATE